MRSGPTHTKSRKGCLVCKARKIKCDESQPGCQRCTASGRECEYAVNRSVRRVASTALLPTANSSNESAATPFSSTSSATNGSGGASSRILTASSRTEACDRSAKVATAIPGAESEHDDPPLSATSTVFTILHLRLLSHAITNMTSFMAADEQMQPVIDYALHCAHTAPYVLDQLLALSALHCSTQQPDTAKDWRYHATDLQTRALSSFNAAKNYGRPKSDIVPSFIFASLLGIQILYTTLAQEHDSLAGFVTDFVAFLRIYRGVRSVIDGNWDEICTSNLEPLLSISRWIEDNEMSGSGTETHRLKRLLESLPDQSNSSVKASLDALGYIQWMLDLKTRADPRSGRGVHITLAWPIVVSNDYAESLYQHRPEALAVLAFFAAALHQHPEFWGFSNAGQRLVRLLVAHVGPFWGEALVWPRECTADVNQEA